MEELGLSDDDSLTIAAPTNLVVLPVVAGTLVGANQIKLPRKFALMIKEGERLMVQPSPLGTPETVVPEPQQAPSLRRQPAGPSSIEWDEIPATSFDEVVGLRPVKGPYRAGPLLSHPPPSGSCYASPCPPGSSYFSVPMGPGKR